MQQGAARLALAELAPLHAERDQLTSPCASAPQSSLPVIGCGILRAVDHGVNGFVTPSSVISPTIDVGIASNFNVPCRSPSDARDVEEIFGTPCHPSRRPVDARVDVNVDAADLRGAVGHDRSVVLSKLPRHTPCVRELETGKGVPDRLCFARGITEQAAALGAAMMNHQHSKIL
jgi:hypothetical protein